MTFSGSASAQDRWATGKLARRRAKQSAANIKTNRLKEINMATLTVIFDTPLPNAGVGDVVSANGSLFLDANVKRGTSIEFGEVTVQFGQNGEVKTATGGLGAWQSTGRVSGSAIGGQPLTISAFSSARYRRADLPDGEDEEVVFGSGE